MVVWCVDSLTRVAGVWIYGVGGRESWVERGGLDGSRKRMVGSVSVGVLTVFRGAGNKGRRKKLDCDDTHTHTHMSEWEM